MIYATRQQLEEVWGPDFVSDLLPEDVDVQAAVDGALERASAEIDSHLSARYPLPLASAPAALVTPCASIAVYMLAIRHTALTTTIEERYKQAIELMKRIADGKAGLGEAEPRVSADTDASTGGAFFSSGPRLFSRERLP